MTRKVTIIDTGIGNLFSARRAFEKCGATDVKIATRPMEIENSSVLVLPGVGAFEKGIAGLAKSNFTDVILKHASLGKPLLGICLGMQLFSTKSYEFGETCGLDLIPGNVRKIPTISANGVPLRVPFVGWAKIELFDEVDQNIEIGRYIGGSHMYHVHSFMFQPDDKSHLIAGYRYGDHFIPSIIRKENVIGVQFHPEKSGSEGLNLLSNLISGRVFD